MLTGESDVRKLTDDQYRRAVSVNVDGVVFGVRRLAQVMDRGTIVATASLAGLTAMPNDAMYSLTKHAVVGFVRSVAPLLAPDPAERRLPGNRRHADDRRVSAMRSPRPAFPLLRPEEVADAVWSAATSEASGECWFVQPGREPAPFVFPNLPGPRAAGERVGRPPL